MRRVRRVRVLAVFSTLLAVAVGLPTTLSFASSLTRRPLEVGARSAAALRHVPAAKLDHASPTSAAAAIRARRLADFRLPLKDVNIQPGGYPPAKWNSLLNLAQNAGVSVISLDVNWAGYEPNGPGRSGEFSTLARFVKDVRSRGLELRFQVVGFPQWARDAGDPSESSQPWRAPASPGELTRWSAWISRLVSYFKSDVAYYEIWNEENNPPFWAQGPNPGEYARLLESSYVAAKRADPGAGIMFGGMDRNDDGFLTMTYRDIDALFPATAVADHHFFDILGVHPYSGSDSPAVTDPYWIYQDAFGTMNGNFLGFEALHETMKREGEGYKRIYIGEYGVSTAPWNDFRPVSPGTQASYLTLAYHLAAKTGYVEGFSWYNFFTTPWNSAGFSLVKGNYPNWKPSPAYGALAHLPDP
jgi:hypothetical protein